MLRRLDGPFDEEAPAESTECQRNRAAQQADQQEIAGGAEGVVEEGGREVEGREAPCQGGRAQIRCPADRGGAGPQQKRPLPEVEEHPVEKARDRAIKSDEPHMLASEWPPAEVARAHANPAAGQHLIGKPGAETGRQHRRENQRERSEREAEPRSHDQAADDDQEKDRREAQHADDHDEAQRRVERDQRGEHGE